MQKFNRYKVSASELPDLMANDYNNPLPTEKDLNEFYRILDKEEIDLTERQIWLIQSVVFKKSNYNPNGLSQTMKKSLYKHYAYAKYGISKVSLTSDTPLQLDKGEIAEPAAIKLLSEYDKVQYVKNEKVYSNKYFKGIPDIVMIDNGKVVGVKDIKVPLDYISFLERIDGDVLKDDIWEMRAYLDILDLQQGEICYCLVDMPNDFKERRLKQHEERMRLIGFTPDHIKRRLKRIEKSMMYDYVMEDKICRFTVFRKGYMTKKMHEKVKSVRYHLQKLHDKLQKPLILSENPDNQE